MPKVSVCSTAFRPGGIDILLAGMQQQTYKDFEVILVDRRYERRHDSVVQMARDAGVSLMHVPEHRRNGKWISFASAWNTCFAVARGELVLLLADWMCPPPDWIERHLALLDGKRRYVIGSYHFLTMPPLKLKKPMDFASVVTEWESTFECVDTSPVFTGEILDEIDVFEAGRFDCSWISSLRHPVFKKDLRTEILPVASEGVDEGWLHIKNDSVARSILMEMNGLDERLERGRGPLDIDLQVRLTANRVGIYWDPGLFVYYMDPHDILPTLPFGGTKRRLEGRWSWEDGLRYVTRRRVEINFGEPPRAKNPWDIKQLEADLASWRDLNTICPIRDVSDLEYWGMPIEPDTA